MIILYFARIREILIDNARGYRIEELEEKRSQKKVERGGFEKRLFLDYVEDSNYAHFNYILCEK